MTSHCQYDGLVLQDQAGKGSTILNDEMFSHFMASYGPSISVITGQNY